MTSQWARALLKKAGAEGKSLTGFRSLKVYEGLEQASSMVTGPWEVRRWATIRSMVSRTEKTWGCWAQWIWSWQLLNSSHRGQISASEGGLGRWLSSTLWWPDLALKNFCLLRTETYSYFFFVRSSLPSFFFFFLSFPLLSLSPLPPSLPFYLSFLFFLSTVYFKLFFRQGRNHH